MKTSLSPEDWAGRFSEEQYDLLIGCAQSSEFKSWNTYRKKNISTPVLLEGADLSTLDLTKADLRRCKMPRANLSSCKLTKTVFTAGDLTGVVLDGSTLEATDFASAKLTDARITSVFGTEVKFRFAEMSGAAFHEARFERSNFDRANLSHATFQASIIRDSNLSNTNLCGTRIVDAQIHGSRFCVSTVDGETLIWNCAVDKETDFTGIGLSSARVEPQLLSRLESNIRSIWWKRWYAARMGEIADDWRKFKKTPAKAMAAPVRMIAGLISLTAVRAFWWSTDYGSSTQRILGVFSLASLMFATLYFFFPWLVNDEIIQSSPNALLRFTRALYFSVVAITTVGFGDIAANKNSVAGHGVVMCNVLLGYTVLTALVVRMGILFNSMPAGNIRPRSDATITTSNAFKSDGGAD